MTDNEATQLRREVNEHNENLSNVFIEEHFGHRMLNFVFNKNSETQKLGIDATWTEPTDGQDIICDFKMVENSGLPTGCLECYMRPRRKDGSFGDSIKGWFFDEKQLNNAIGYLWLDAYDYDDIVVNVDEKKNPVHLKKIKKIWKAELIVFKKIDAWYKLQHVKEGEENKLDLEIIKKLVNKSILGHENTFHSEVPVNTNMKLGQWSDKPYRRKKDDTTVWYKGVGFNSPSWLYNYERPINVLMPREAYREIALHCEVYDDRTY